MKENRRDAAVAMNCLASVVESGDGGDGGLEEDRDLVCGAVRT